MKAQARAETFDAAPVDGARPNHLAHQAREFNGVWMSAETAAAFLDFTGRKPVLAFRAWARRHGVPTARRGSRLLWAKADLERAIGASHRKGL